MLLGSRYLQYGFVHLLVCFLTWALAHFRIPSMPCPLDGFSLNEIQGSEAPKLFFSCPGSPKGEGSGGMGIESTKLSFFF